MKNNGMLKKKKVLISFAGNNDAGALAGKPDGAVLTALRNEKFDEVMLLYNNSADAPVDFSKVVDYLTIEIRKRKLARKVYRTELSIEDVTDHNHVYSVLRDFTDKLKKDQEIEFTAAISSGTPAMQVCWILLAESGDFSVEFPLRLIKVKDPKFGSSGNTLVKIDTSLPRIIRLKEEIAELKRELIPPAEILLEKATLAIGGEVIPLSPIELSYYIYFAELNIRGKGDEKFSGFTAGNDFLKRILELHTELFPSLDTNRLDLEKMLKKGTGLAMTTFRGNVSKINSKIRTMIDNEEICHAYGITASGTRGAKFYGIHAPEGKIRIIP